MSTEMIPSVIDYLLQLPEVMHFAKVHELCSDGISLLPYAFRLW
ncbi:MAG: hypothetical protein ACLTS6_08640 [Anaerobutyricum sp.]